MKVLVHFKKQQLNSFIEQLIQLHYLYGTRSYELDAALLQYLETVQQYYKQIGASNEELSITELTSYFKTAQSGIDPRNLEKLKLGKRDNVLMSAFHCLNTVGALLKNNLDTTKQVLADARQTINNILLNLMQSGTLTQKTIQRIKTIDQCEAMWNKLRQEQQINLLDKKLKLTITEKDIIILLDQQLTLIKDL